METLVTFAEFYRPHPLVLATKAETFFLICDASKYSREYGTWFEFRFCSRKFICPWFDFIALK
jgi:hypothetical protein